MRFVRAYTRSDTGDLVNVTEQETLFTTAGIMLHDVPFALELHDLGLVEDFAPTDPDTGEPCSPSMHLFKRMERSPDAAAPGRAQFREKAGHALPPFIDCPSSLEGIKQRIREGGIEAIPAKARAWLTLMLPSHQVAELGVGRGIPVSALMALDEMRQRRDPSVGSRRVRYEREAQEISDERTAAALKRRGVA